MPVPSPEGPFERLPKLARQSGPLMLVLVGPNGSGKSTFYQRHLATISLPFINADVLAQTLIQAGAPAGEATERLAAEPAEKKRQDLIAQRESFITETVFPIRSGQKLQALRAAQVAGYTVVLIFLCVDSAELTALRVASRVRDGGHRVPLEKIAARYERMQQNAMTALTFVDFAIVVGNSSVDTPRRPVAATANGKVIHLNPPRPTWAENALPEK